MHDQAIDRVADGIECQIHLLPPSLIRQRLAGLRSQTAPAHARLDEQIETGDWLCSLNGYTRLLTRFYGIYQPLEPLLRAAVDRFGLPLDMGARRKSERLTRDLLALGLSPEAVRALPRARELPTIDTREAALGCLYVVEGATLGGQVIARRIRRDLGIDADSGAAFFLSYGDDVGRRWQAFCSILADALRTTAAERTIAAAAGTMFAGIGSWLRDGGAVHVWSTVDVAS